MACIMSVRTHGGGRGGGDVKAGEWVEHVLTDDTRRACCDVEMRRAGSRGSSGSSKESNEM
eukprot:751172-Hanusia_phi.AAC.18